MNIKNNLVSVLIFLGVMIIIGFVVLLLILDKPIDQYMGSLTTIITVVAGLGLLGNRIDKVSKNVNGNTTRMLNEIERLRAKEANGTLGNDEQPNADIDPMTEQTITKLRTDADSLPSHRAND